MKINIGETADQPLLSATFKQKALKELAQRDGFSQFYDSLASCSDIRIERHSKAETFTLLAKKLGRRPAAAHEAYLKPYVRLLKWGCVAQRKNQMIDGVYRLDEIETEPSLNGSYRVESIMIWPSKKDKVVSELATTAMQSFGEQLRYGSYRRQADYDREVYVGLDRTPPADEDDPELRHLTIHTATGLKGNLRVDSGTRGNSNFVEVGGNYIRSHKEQLVHLVGAVAVAYADGRAPKHIGHLCPV